MLEEVDECIDGECHFQASVLMGVIKGEVDVDFKRGLEVKITGLEESGEITQ
jgi:hypothetical protein